MKFENDVLIALRRKYSDNEKMAHILNRFKELKKENGCLKSELNIKNQVIKKQEKKKANIEKNKSKKKPKDIKTFLSKNHSKEHLNVKIESLHKKLINTQRNSDINHHSKVFFLNKLREMLSEEEIEALVNESYAYADEAVSKKSN